MALPLWLCPAQWGMGAIAAIPDGILQDGMLPNLLARILAQVYGGKGAIIPFSDDDEDEDEDDDDDDHDDDHDHDDED